MRNIQEEVTSYSWELMLRFLGLTGEVLSNAERAGEFAFEKAENATRGILTLMIDKARKRANEKGLDEDDNVKVLTMMEKRAKKNNETLRNVIVADEDAAELIQKLKENNVLFVSRDIDGDNAKMVMYLSGDDYSVQKAVNALMVDRGLVTEIDADEFVDTRLNNGIGTVDGLDDVELEAFREYAKTEKLPFARINTSKESNLIIYEPEKSEELKRVLSSATWALSGDRGKEIRNGLAARVAARKELYSAIEDKKEHIILSAKNQNHYILIDDKEAALYKNNKKVQSVSRESRDFFEKSLQMSDGLEDVVVLNKGEYALNGTVEEMRVLFHVELVEERTKSLVSKQDLDKMFDEANERRRLIEEKMALDDENQNPFWIFDNSYSYSSATAHEEIDDNDTENQQEREAVDKTIRRLKALSIEEIPAPAQKGIDAIIARAEQRKLEKIRAEKDNKEKDNKWTDFAKE